MTRTSLDLLRHGDAAALGPAGDASRPLTPRGQLEVARIAERIAAAGVRYRHVCSSPLARARESAAIVLSRLIRPPVLVTLRELAPNGEPEEVLEALARLDEEGGHALLVGHQPLLGNLVTFLAGVAPAVRPATLVRLAGGEIGRSGSARIEAVWTPDPEP
jgi:phosphohistidine phosphatase